MEYVLVPRSFFVGDIVELYYPLNEFQISSLNSLNVENIIQNENITIKSISIINKNDMNYLYVKFIPWEVGLVSLPSMENLGIDFKLPSFNVSSTLEIEELQSITLQDVRPPILMDGTVYLLYQYISFSLVFSLSVILFTMFIKRNADRFLRFFLKYFAMTVFYLSLKISKKKLAFIKNNDGDKLVDEISVWLKHYEKILRRFLFSFYDFKDDLLWKAFTYDEMSDKITNMYNEDSDVLDCLHFIFNTLSVLRFSNVAHESFSNIMNLLDYSFYLIKLKKN